MFTPTHVRWPTPQPALPPTSPVVRPSRTERPALRPTTTADWVGHAAATAARTSPTGIGQAFAPPLPKDAASAPWPPAVLLPSPYPASNDPSVLTALHPVMCRSPLLMQQLQALQQAGWTINWTRGGGASCDHFGHRFNVDINCDPLVVVQILAHEVSHAFDGVILPPHYPNESAFLAASMRGEAKAVVNQLRVRDEIGRASGQDIGISFANPGYYHAAFDFHKRHGSYERLLQQVEKMYVWEATSLDNAPYCQYYGNMFRRFHGQPPMAVPMQYVEAGRQGAMAQLQHEMQWG